MDGGGLGISTRAARICMSMAVLVTTLTTFGVPGAAADAAPTWPKARFDVANAAFNSTERWLSTGNVTSLARDWSTRLNQKESPLVAGGVISGCEEDSYRALDATNGSVRWRTLVGPAVGPVRPPSSVASCTRPAAWPHS